VVNCLGSTTAVVANTFRIPSPRTTGAIQNSIAPRLDFRPILSKKRVIPQIFKNLRTAKAVEFRIAPVVRGEGTRKVFATAEAVELFVPMIVSNGLKHHQSGIFISTKEKRRGHGGHRVGC